MALRAVIFDLDDTLADRRAALSAFSDRFIQEHASALGVSDRDAIRACVREADENGYRDKRAVLRDMVERLQWKNAMTGDEFVAYWGRTFPECTVPMASLEEVLDTVRRKGFLLGLITNGRSMTQHAKIDRLGIRDRFDCVIVSGDEGIHKPDPRVFRSALERLGVSAEEAVYVGDHPGNDVRGARDAGLAAVWMARGDRWPEEYGEAPEHTVSSLDEFAAWLEQQLN